MFIFSCLLIYRYLLFTVCCRICVLLTLDSLTPPVSTHFVDRGRVRRRYYRVTTCHSTLSPLLDLSCVLYKGHTLRHVACARVLSLSLSLATCLSRSPRVSLSTRVSASRLSAALGSSRSSAIYSHIDPVPPSVLIVNIILKFNYI